MTTISGDHGHAGLRNFNISCGDALPVSIAFTDNPRMIVSGERNPNHPGGRLLRYHIAPDPACKINAPENLDAIALNAVDRVVVSKDGKWIVIISGTNVMVRNMTTDEVVEVDEHKSGMPVHAVDIAPDSTKFATGSQDKTVRIFSLNTGNLLFKLSQHENSVLGVKFSPNGEYLATAAFGDFIRVWDTRNSYMLMQTSDDIVYGPTPDADAAVQSIPLGWSSHSDRVFTISSGLVTIFQSSPTSLDMPYYTGERPGYVIRFADSAPASNNSTFYALATNGRIIAYAAGSSLSFWDTFSSSKIGPTITFRDPILSLAFSSDDSYLACGKGNKHIIVYLLRDMVPLHDIIDPTHLPFMNVNYKAFQFWIQQHFDTAGRTLPQEQKRSSYHSLANYALIRAHPQAWCTAFESATKSLAAGPSIIGHIALARALVGLGQHEPAFDAFDAVFRTCGADDIRFLLLIKAILLFLSGKRENAITRVKDLISSADDSEKYDCLQVLGNMYLIQGDWKEAFESFERARAHSFFRRGHHLMTILLIFGPSFEEREIALRHPLREAGLGKY